jgi:hypothetical protein
MNNYHHLRSKAKTKHSGLIFTCTCQIYYIMISVTYFLRSHLFSFQYGLQQDVSISHKFFFQNFRAESTASIYLNIETVLKHKFHSGVIMYGKD